MTTSPSARLCSPNSSLTRSRIDGSLSFRLENSLDTKAFLGLAVNLSVSAIRMCIASSFHYNFRRDKMSVAGARLCCAKRRVRPKKQYWRLDPLQEQCVCIEIGMHKIVVSSVSLSVCLDCISGSAAVGFYSRRPAAVWAELPPRLPHRRGLGAAF